jgi:hypothetical protein
MAKAFSAMDYFRKHGTAKRTAVNVGGLSLRLDGAPATYTDAALGKLADGQAEPVRVATPRAETDGGIVVRSTAVFTGREVGTLIREYAAATDKGEADVPEAVKARTATVGTNGTV